MAGHEDHTSSVGGQQPKTRGEGGSEREHGGDSGGVTSPALQLPAAGAKAASPFHDRACSDGGTVFGP